MKKYVRYRTYFLSVIVIAAVFVPQKYVFGQSDLITLDVTLSPALENAQVLGLSSLGVNNELAGPVLFHATLTNNTDELLTNLFFDFKITAEQVGVLAKVTQQAAYPFTLDPHQVVFVTNNDIQNNDIPGIDESLKFDGGLTITGEDFIESLGGSTTLPNDIYTFSLTVFQVTNADGRKALATHVVELGGVTDGIAIDEKSIFLKTPGDEIGADVTITNQYPQFSWEGDAANTYRILVVRSNGQDSPESLIESAKSSEPTQTGGSLLQFENLDVEVQGNSYQYPASGAQALVAGQTYFWQVTTQITSPAGSEELTSDIWSFKLTSPSDAVTQVQIDQTTFDALISLVGEEQYAQLTESGFYFYSLEYDNQLFSNIPALLKLSEIHQKIEDGDIIVNSN